MGNRSQPLKLNNNISMAKKPTYLWWAKRY